jgi:phage tail P2-like protein
LTLLPPNASQLFTTVEAVTALDERLPTEQAIAGAKIDAVTPLAPWLFWEYAVGDVLPLLPIITSPEERKSVIQQALQIHRLKGTPAAIRLALASMGHEDVVIEEGLPAVRHNGAERRGDRLRYDGAARWAQFRVALSLGDDAGINAASAERVLATIDTVKAARSKLYALALRVTPTASRHDDPAATVGVRLGLAVPARRVGIRDGTHRRGGATRLPRDGSTTYDASRDRRGLTATSPQFGENALRLRARLALRLALQRQPHLPRDGACRYDARLSRRHAGPLSVLQFRIQRHGPTPVEVGFLVADPLADVDQLAALVVVGPDGSTASAAITVTVDAHSATVAWHLSADVAADITNVTALELRRADGNIVTSLTYAQPWERVGDLTGTWTLRQQTIREVSMSTTYLPAYYDGMRRLLATGDPALRLAHVAVGSSSAADAVEITDAYRVPVSAILFDPVEPRRMTLRWTLPRDAAVGMVIREIGLERADGVLVARMVRSSGIEKTADMEIGDFWQLDV